MSGARKYRTVSFHEASLTRFVQAGDLVTLDLEGVPVDGYAADEKSVSICAVITGVQMVTRNGEPVQGVTQEAEDAEVLTLRQKENSVVLVVTWRRYRPAWSETVAYEFPGAKLTY